jgi:fucose permease
MSAISASRWLCLCSVVAVAAIAVASLIPTQWELRTGLHWLIEHFVIYFAVTTIICLAWPRPFVVATSLIVLAGLLEALQGLTLDRTPDLLTAVSGAGGVLTAALLFWLVICVWKVALHRPYDIGCERGLTPLEGGSCACSKGNHIGVALTSAPSPHRWHLH